MILKDEAQIKKILPQNRDPKTLFESLNSILPRYEIDTVERVSAFIGQCGHESQQFMMLTENLNYTASGLRKIFPAYFPTDKKALQFAHNPQKIANLVYANRMGNGDENSGDGWTFRGHGFLQITGRYMFEKFAGYINKSIEETMLYSKSLDGAMEISCWYWKTKNINADADRLDILGVTQKINPRLLGIEHRKYITRLALNVLGNNETKIPDTLKLGMTGEYVMSLQKQLTNHGYRVTIDGHYGKGTENAVKQLQIDSGLIADGIAGPKTRMILQ